jgi:ADP-heptose:LPS heptosyltransferase/glycosyltransferase involved in cell wall biosynthesis
MPDSPPGTAPPRQEPRVGSEQAEWVAFAPLAPPPPAMLAHLPERAALLDLSHRAGAPQPPLWRRAYLDQLRASGVVPPDAAPAALEAAALRHPLAHRPGRRLAETQAAPPAGRRVFLISRFGVERFGGAEHFVLQMARLYRSMGHAPLILGTRPERAGEQGEVEGIPYAFVPETPEALFRLAWQERPVIAHVVSGLGYEVALALRFLDVRLVFGVHFWREMFHAPSINPGYFPDCPEGHARRPEFELLLADLDAIYTNSAFTRAVLAAHFGPLTPVIPSLPDDLDATPPAEPEGREIVLLANARADKGFTLLLALAALCPGWRFVAVASQSSAAQARAAAAPLPNVEVLERVPDLAPLYARARAVLVPSYRFVETFSRVVVEAQRQGVPVIGSDRGNVPLLLAESGVSLPPDPAAWAAELTRLFEDPAYWRDRAARGQAVAARNGFAAQAGRLERLLAGLDAPILVGVGSGLGNVIHATPLLRNLARRLGRPVDVVVAGDQPGAAAVVAHPDHIRHVFPLAEVVLRRRYQSVFLTHSFGDFVPPFRAERVLRSRDWANFHAGHALHEAEFNLAAAAALLGVPYDPADVRACHVGEVVRRSPPSVPLVGLHAGSKTGIWAAKRWPHFAELAARLMARGIEVASFGTADEYVPGTQDRTGGTMIEMAEAMAGCSAFVANDSGVMNVANALGLPLVALFAPTEPRTRGPLGPASLTLALGKSCAPCELAGMSGPFGRQTCRCIAEIPVETVEAALLDRLAAAHG